MKKSSEYLVKKLFLHFFILLIVSILYAVISGIINFYNTNYQADLMKLFLRTYVLNGLVFYLPAFILSFFSYTINASFPKKLMDKLNVDSEYIFFKSFYIFLITFSFLIIFIGLLTQKISDINDKLELTNNKIKLNIQRNKQIESKFEDIDKLIKEKKFYDALDVANDIIMISPDNSTAEEKIKLLNELIRDNAEQELRKLKKDGISFYEKKKYKQALKNFIKIINIDPNDKIAKKYITIINNLLSIENQKLIKDKYTSLIYFNRKNSPVTARNRKIYQLVITGKDLFGNKKYLPAKKKFKEILKIDLYNYDARRYLEKINNKLAQINYFTNRDNKLIKKNIFYNTRYNNAKYLFTIEELRKSSDNQYILFNTTIYKFGKAPDTLKFKYGYLDFKKRKYVFLNSFMDKHIKKTYIDFIYPKILWIRENIIKNPELFPLGEIIKLKRFLQLDKTSFVRLIVVKVNYYILLLLLFFLLIPLSFHAGRKYSKAKFNFYTILFLPVFSLLIYKLYYILFFTLKNFINAGFSVNIMYGLFFNILFYIFVYIFFKILISLIKEPNLIKNEKSQKVS